MIQLIWLLLILAEVARNYYIIEIEKRNPDHDKFMVYRSLVGVLYWLLAAPLLSKLDAHWFGMELIRPDQWWPMPIMLGLTFHCIFNWVLNVARKRPYWYLGGKSKIDLWQREHGGAFAWFWWRLILMLGSISLFATGWSAVQEYPGLGANYFM